MINHDNAYASIKPRSTRIDDDTSVLIESIGNCGPLFINVQRGRNYATACMVDAVKWVYSGELDGVVCGCHYCDGTVTNTRFRLNLSPHSPDCVAVVNELLRQVRFVESKLVGL